MSIDVKSPFSTLVERWLNVIDNRRARNFWRNRSPEEVSGWVVATVLDTKHDKLHSNVLASSNSPKAIVMALVVNLWKDEPELRPLGLDHSKRFEIRGWRLVTPKEVAFQQAFGKPSTSLEERLEEELRELEQREHAKASDTSICPRCGLRTKGRAAICPECGSTCEPAVEPPHVAPQQNQGPKLLVCYLCGNQIFASQYVQGTPCDICGADPSTWKKR